VPAAYHCNYAWVDLSVGQLLLVMQSLRLEHRFAMWVNSMRVIMQNLMYCREAEKRQKAQEREMRQLENGKHKDPADLE